MALSLSEINALTQEFIAPGVADGIFLNDPLLAFMKANQPMVFPGGKTFDEMFMYDRENGGPYDRTNTSNTFTITQKDIANRTTHNVKHYYSNVSVVKEEIQVINVGPEAAFRIIDLHMVNAALKLSEDLAVDLYGYGTDESGGDGTDRSLRLNGLAEIINDNVVDSYELASDVDGQTFDSYGTILRSDVNNALDGNVTDVSGSISYKTLEETYQETVVGAEQPDLGVTTNKGIAFIKQKFQPQQRFSSVDPTIGFTGLEFNSARIMVSQYAPGENGFGENLLDAGEGEVLWWLNTKHFRLWITADPEFAFGFSGFKGERDDNLLAGQMFFAGNVTCVQPRFQGQLNRITG